MEMSLDFATMPITPADCTRPLPYRRHETLARLLADGRKRLSDEELASLTRMSESRVIQLRQDDTLLKRIQFIQQGNLRRLIPRALATLTNLLDSKHDTVRLKAAVEILDRGGLRLEEAKENQPAFSLTLNLSGSEGGLKTATSLGPPPLGEEFLPAGDQAQAIESVEFEEVKE